MNQILPVTAADPSPDEARWQSVLRRDRAADGAFVFAVRSTGVFCRPSCPARRPRRANVSFHDTPAQARLAGFRPCLRCRPEQAQDRHAPAIQAALRLIAAAETPPGLEALAAAAGLSPHHFHRVFKQAVGLTPKAYTDARRAQRTRAALPRAASVTQAFYDAGFNSSGRFYAASEAMLGMAPARFRAGGAGETIRFATSRCSLGAILVAATPAGLCAILLGDDPASLAAELAARFPRAALAAGDAAFESLVAQVVAFMDDPAGQLDLPLDVRGTAFQHRVWTALRAIPPGRTESYTALAARAGAPGAVRAVASACAANPLAVAIPCHRAVRQDGGLAGYRWGLDRKRALLKREAP
jgi:AraC family transcriptional regulator of adaptative response/methylated-DNA-[protein]-cysteine methyltransferase